VNAMECSEFDGRIVEMARGRLGEAERADVLQHVESCKPCSARLREELLLTSALGSIASEAPAAGEHVEARVRAAFRSAKLRPVFLFRAPVWAALGVAASLMLAVALRVPRHEPAEEASPKVDVADAELDDFVPLAIEEPWAEGDAVVRISLPSSVATSLGLEAPGEAELVDADVIVGEDGAGRAIRLVR